MVNDAARILKTVQKRGKGAVGYQGMRLATIKSVEPLKMLIDDISCEFTADDVLVNAQMVDFTHTGKIEGSTGDRYISMNNASITLKSVFQTDDRVAVASVGVNKFLIICKVVNWK